MILNQILVPKLLYIQLCFISAT